MNQNTSVNSVNSTTTVALTPEETFAESYAAQHFGQNNSGGCSINKSSSFIFDNHHQRNLMKPTSKLIHSYSTSAIVKNPHNNNSSLSQAAADTTTSSIMEFPELG
mgnify:CR=1 FL=1